MTKYILLFLLFSIAQITAAQQKEVLLIGTMHTVPNIVKKSYKPLLRRAIKYQPETIYVESPMPNDTISWEYLKDGWSTNYKNFYFLSDSLKHNFQYDSTNLESLLSKDFSDLSKDDLELIINSFGFLRDIANYDFYSYIKEYGLKGPKKPTRHEDGDLTSKLALKLGIKKLKAMDDQQTNEEYHAAWKNCGIEGRGNGDNAIGNKINKKHDNKAIVPALFRGLGMYVNNRKSLERLHQLASFTYIKNDTENCLLGEKYWNERNYRMAQNIGSQIRASSNKKNIVIVGAAHIIRIEKELKEKFPDIKVLLINE